MTDEIPLYPEYAMRFVCGDTWRRRVQVTDPDPDSPDPENPIMIGRNLDGYSYRAQVRANTKVTTSITATLEVTVDQSEENGWIILHLPPDESQKVTRRSGWDLEQTDPNGDVETILGGPSDPTGDYTR